MRQKNSIRIDLRALAISAEGIVPVIVAGPIAAALIFC